MSEDERSSEVGVPPGETIVSATSGSPAGGRRVRPARLAYHTSRYTAAMGPAISVRLDEEAEQALRTLEAAGLTRSEAIRVALVHAAQRLRRSSELAAEVAALDADPDDAAEMHAVSELMESLRAPG